LIPQWFEDLEGAQTQGARQIFGKRAKCSVINEALRGDLGWLSVQSQVAIAKLMFYGHLCRLPSSRLLKEVCLDCKWQHDMACAALDTRTFDDASWHSKISTIFHAIGLTAEEMRIDAVAILPKTAWNRRIKDLVRKCDSKLLFENFGRTQSGIFYANIKQAYGQKSYIWQHDRRSTLLKFYLRSRSYGLDCKMQLRRFVLSAHWENMKQRNTTSCGAQCSNKQIALDKKRLQVALSVAMQQNAQEAPPPGEARISAADLTADSKKMAKEMMPMFDAKISAVMQKAVQEGVKAAHLPINVKLPIDGVAKKVNKAIKRSPAAQILLPGMEPLLQKMLEPLLEAARETTARAANTKTVANVLKQYVAQHLVPLGVKVNTLLSLMSRLDDR
jgi:hypothetical protein